MPGAFPEAEEEHAPVPRTPKKRFVGRKYAEAKRAGTHGASVEEMTAIVQNGESSIARRALCLTQSSPSTNASDVETDPR